MMTSLKTTLALSLLLILGTACEGTTGADDATSSGGQDVVRPDTTGGLVDNGGQQQGRSYGWIVVRDGFNDQLVNSSSQNPGADIDAVELQDSAGSTVTYCQTVTYQSADSLGRASNAGKNPPPGAESRAVGAPDAGCTVGSDAGCVLWDDSSVFIWLNGGQIICGLGGEAVNPGDTILVYEVFNGASSSEIDRTREEFKIFLSDTADLSNDVVELGTGQGVAPVQVPANLF